MRLDVVRLALCFLVRATLLKNIKKIGFTIKSLFDQVVLKCSKIFAYSKKCPSVKIQLCSCYAFFRLLYPPYLKVQNFLINQKSPIFNLLKNSLVGVPRIYSCKLYC
jgi:hypothetical protein